MSFISSLIFFIYWCKTQRERERERERERSICRYTYLCIHWFLLVCALPEIKHVTLMYQDDALTNWATWHLLFNFFEAVKKLFSNIHFCSKTCLLFKVYFSPLFLISQFFHPPPPLILHPLYFCISSLVIPLSTTFVNGHNSLLPVIYPWNREMNSLGLFSWLIWHYLVPLVSLTQRSGFLIICILHSVIQLLVVMGRGDWAPGSSK